MKTKIKYLGIIILAIGLFSCKEPTAAINQSNIKIVKISTEKLTQKQFITIYGSNFGDNTNTSKKEVYFTDVKVDSIQWWKNDSIRVLVPDIYFNPLIYVKVGSDLSNKFQVYFNNIVVIDSISQDNYYLGESMTLRIYGRNFLQLNEPRKIFFNAWLHYPFTFSVGMDSIQQWSDTLIICKSPFKNGDNYYPMVGSTNYSVSSINKLPFKVNDIPTLISINPKAFFPGTKITLNFDKDYWNYNPGTLYYENIRSDSSLAITQNTKNLLLTTPNNIQSGKLGFKGGSIVGNKLDYTVLQFPVIETLSPQSAAPNSEVTITGKNFADSSIGLKLTLNGQIITTFNEWTTNRIKFMLPVGCVSGDIYFIFQNVIVSNKLPITIIRDPINWGMVKNLNHVTYLNGMGSYNIVQYKDDGTASDGSYEFSFTFDTSTLAMKNFILWKHDFGEGHGSGGVVYTHNNLTTISGKNLKLIYADADKFVYIIEDKSQIDSYYQHRYSQTIDPRTGTSTTESTEYYDPANLVGQQIVFSKQ